MRPFLPLLYLVLVLSACSNQHASVIDSAPKQVLSFSKDTLYLREQDVSNILSTNNGVVTVYVKDAAHQLNLMRDDTATQVHVQYRGAEIASGRSLPLMDSISLFVFADTPGKYAVHFFLSDRLGRVIERVLPVACAASSRAEPNFSYWYEGPAGWQNFPYVFDASLSAKPDGVITRYRFFVNGAVIESSQPVVHWVFHNKGEQVIGLSVTDDLNRVSDTVYQKITIL